MNIHPLFVHFPIAFFVLYVALEIITPKKDIHSPRHLVKTILLLAWSIGAQIALYTGEMAESIAGHSAMIEMHSLFANITTIVFGINTLVYLRDYIVQKWNIILQYAGLRYVHMIVSFVKRYYLHVLLALLWLIAVTYTGALGGAMVYGSDIDPVVHFLINTIPWL